jgi:hypothetical protein
MAGLAESIGRIRLAEFGNYDDGTVSGVIETPLPHNFYSLILTKFSNAKRSLSTMDLLKNWFRDQGLGPEDIPKVFCSAEANLLPCKTSCASIPLKPRQACICLQAVIIHEILGAGEPKALQNKDKFDNEKLPSVHSTCKLVTPVQNGHE